jgi:hypothetical protein
MATQTQQWIPLEDIVTAYIDQSEQSPNKYLKLWNIAYRAMTEMGLDAFYSIKTELLPVNANLTVSLPEDYLQYTKVGYLTGTGEVSMLRRNDNIAKLKPFSNTDEGIEAVAFDPNSPNFYGYWYGGVPCVLQGVACGDGGFTIQEEEGLLFLNNVTADSIVVEYLATPNPDTDYKVPIQFQEAIIAFLAWRDIQFIPSSRRGTVTDKAQRRKDYYNERRLAIARYKPLRLQEFYK